MPQCSIKTCSSKARSGLQVHYHRFPVDSQIRAKWIRVCGGIPTAASPRVCSRHFSPQCYEMRGMPPKPRLKRGAIPDIDVVVEEGVMDVLLALGLVPRKEKGRRNMGGMPQE